jgi:hypothetical protein
MCRVSYNPQRLTCSVSENKKFHLNQGTKTVLWCMVQYGETARERDKRRPLSCGDAANLNGVFSHYLYLEQISQGVLGLYSLNKDIH